jgi:hypothetical protein
MNDQKDGRLKYWLAWLGTARVIGLVWVLAAE